jgi:hypothetical protein
MATKNQELKVLHRNHIGTGMKNEVDEAQR